jgi:hypothetical protein
MPPCPATEIENRMQTKFQQQFGKTHHARARLGKDTPILPEYFLPLGRL